jgi:hypothetical protein
LHEYAQRYINKKVHSSIAPQQSQFRKNPNVQLEYPKQNEAYTEISLSNINEPVIATRNLILNSTDTKN